MTTDAYVAIPQAPAGMASARDRLLAAMDIADEHGFEIPCKTDPDSFTSDLLSFTSGQAHMLAVDLAQQCDTCPVFKQCAGWLDEIEKTRAARPFGVIAGHLVTARAIQRIDTQGES
jgi:hypothetical protein